MGKGNKEMLKNILLNTEAIMVHLKIKEPMAKPLEKAAAKVIKKAAVKKPAVKKAVVKK